MDGHTASSLPPAAEGTPPHVYVLDADPAFLEVAGNLLAEAGVRMTLAPFQGTADELLAGLRAAVPDLLLLDVVPQRANAGQILTSMRADPALAAVPVLLMSTNPTAAQRVAEPHAALVRDLLAKPFDIDDFIAKITRLLGRGRDAP